MNILNMALKELKTTIRDKKTLMFMLLFPLILILILGTALTSAFGSDNPIQLDKIKIIYKDKSDGQVSMYFNEFIKKGKEEGIKFDKAADEADALAKVEKNKYPAYIEISNKGVSIYENDKNSIDASIVEGMLKSFIDKYKLISEVQKVAPERAFEVINASDENNYIKETTLNSDKAPGAMDYYSIAMTTMIALYGALSASFLIRGERMRRTDVRLIASPIKRSEILVGKVLGGIVATLLCVLVVVFASKFVFKANWGSNIGLVILVLLTEVILATSFGLGISYLTKKPEASRVIVTIVIQVVSFIGGAYFPIDTTSNSGGMMNLLVKLSPLTWNREGINKLIYTGSHTAIIAPILLNLSVACIFLIISALIAGRREAL